MAYPRIAHHLLPALLLFTLSCGGGGGSTATAPPPPPPPPPGNASLIFLHHSTGANVWGGGVPAWFTSYNATHGTNYTVTEAWFQTSGNDPRDFWDVWVNTRSGQHTLANLVGTYKVVMFKHCFPVSAVDADTGHPDPSSTARTQENYKAQYALLKEEMRKYPDTIFIVWTGAALVQEAVQPDQAQRARDFFTWVKNTWDTPGDNIFVWDFHELETEGGLYLKAAYAAGAGDSHPNASFCQTVAPYLCNRIVDVLQGRGDTGRKDGKP